MAAAVRPPQEHLETLAATFRESGYNRAATARAMKMANTTVFDHLKMCVETGLLGDDDMGVSHRAHAEKYLDARNRKLADYQRKKRKGDWRKPVLITLPYEPFRLKLFGDPHLDADGCDFELFEKAWLGMDAQAGVYGLCVGDFFNNWLKALAHLWKDEGRPSDAWTCFEYLMEQRGDALLAACSGNHDDWTHAPADPVDALMKRHGVAYRKGAIRPLLAFRGAPDGAAFTIALRHKWRGASIYSAAHGIRRAVEKGWHDLISVGGHIHQDESRTYTNPENGEHTHICQLSAFKDIDEHVDVQGYQGSRISPIWELVVDPRLPGTDPDKVKVFWDETKAQHYLEAIR